MLKEAQGINADNALDEMGKTWIHMKLPFLRKQSISDLLFSPPSP